MRVAATVGSVRQRADNHQQRVRIAPVGLDHRTQRFGIDVRLLMVDQHHRIRLLGGGGDRQRIEAGASAVDAVGQDAVLDELLAPRRALGVVAVDAQHAQARQRAWFNGRTRHARQRQVELEPEGAALALRAVGADRPAHHLDQQFADRQPQPGAAEAARGAGVSLGKFVEDGLQVFVRQPDPGIGDGDAQAAVLRPLANQAHVQQHIAGRRELDGVAEQVGHHLADAAWVAHQHLRQVRRIIDHQVQPARLRRQRLAAGERFKFMQQVEGNRFKIELARLDLGKVEDVVDQRQQALGAGVGHAGELALAFRQLGVEQQLEHADHAIHRGADLVAHVGQEGAFGHVRFVGHDLGAHRFVALGLALAQRHDGGADGVADGGHFAVGRAVADAGVKVALGDAGQRFLQVVQRTQRVAHAPDDGRHSGQQHQRQHAQRHQGAPIHGVARRRKVHADFDEADRLAGFGVRRHAVVEQLAALDHLANWRERLDRAAHAKQALDAADGRAVRAHAGGASGIEPLKGGRAALVIFGQHRQVAPVVHAHQANVRDARGVAADARTRAALGREQHLHREVVEHRQQLARLLVEVTLDQIIGAGHHRHQRDDIRQHRGEPQHGGHAPHQAWPLHGVTGHWPAP